MTGSPSPEVLRWARESANLSLGEVARRMNEDPDVLRLWESGETSPTYPQLEKLAYEVYRRPLAVFFFPGAPIEAGPKERFRTLPDAEVEDLSPNAIRLVRHTAVMQLNLAELWGGRSPATRRVLDYIGIPAFSELVRTAEMVRAFMGIELETQTRWQSAEEAVKHWRDALEDCGVFVVKAPFGDVFRGEGISGICLYDDEFPVICVNNSMPKTRQIFTMFHELAHLLFHTGGIDRLDDSFIKTLRVEGRRIEVFCNSFTGEFLVPMADFRGRIAGVRQFDDVFVSSLADDYSVSREVILRKLLDLSLIDQADYEERSQRWIDEAKSRERHGENGGNYYYTRMAYLGPRYLDVVFTRYYQNRISALEASQYLGIALHNLPNLESYWLDAKARQ